MWWPEVHAAQPLDQSHLLKSSIKRAAQKEDRQFQFQFSGVTTLTRRLHRPPLPEGEGWGEGQPKLVSVGRDLELEQQARELLCANGAARIANDLRVEWNPRLKSCAGRADYGKKLISLNPQLLEVGNAFAGTKFSAGKLAAASLTSCNNSNSQRRDQHAVPRDEIDRTFRHELAHLLAQFRAGRRRILPHGKEWREACADLGIADEKRCHNLPFRFIERARRFLYKCPNCNRDFPRVHKIRRAIACLACCRKHNHGDFDMRFRLRLVSS
jgi:predicted SprT family Zn-dependent metalloprotease